MSAGLIKGRTTLCVSGCAVILLTLLIALGITYPSRVQAADPSLPIHIDSASAQPRSVEDSTAQAVERDYRQAWQRMAQALELNNPSLLGTSFAGTAQDRLTRAIAEQAKNGLRRKLVDRGHRLRVIFYSLDGSAMQVEDTAQVEIQLLDGNNVLHSEQAKLQYIAVLTPGENAWKVRILEGVPGF